MLIRNSRWVLLPWLLVSTWRCSAPNPNVQVRRMKDGLLQVKGPLAGPYKTLEELAAGACEIMTSQPGASNGAYGFEYCALHYYSRTEDAFFLSYLSDIGGTKGGGRKYCEMPRYLDDPEHKDAIILGGDHSHPNNRKFSNEDTSEARHWRPTRFVDAQTRRIWDRTLLLFFKERTGECRAYLYNNTTRLVMALREGRWVPIGKATGFYGEVELFDGQDWLP